MAIARWEQAGRVAGVITQNIDGLHQLAGSRVVHELHGTAREVECVDCGGRFEPLASLAEYRASQAPPPCPTCGGRLKSATVLFGQPMPAEAMRDSEALAKRCDLFLAIGSSLVVYPAAGLPEIASRSGARLVIINRDPTEQDATADAVIHEPIGATLSSIDEAMALARQRPAAG